MKTPVTLTQIIVKELIYYDPEGSLIWKPRDRCWFNSDMDWKRWNNRYAGAHAFTYVAKGYRWGSIFDNNYLAHRVVWLYVHGRWPRSIVFNDGDGTNLKLSNLVERIPIKTPRERFTKPYRERLPLPIAA